MTDKDIIKALECCQDDECRNCHMCPYLKVAGCQIEIFIDALDLIKRLQEENERLKADCDKIAEDYSNLIIEKDELFDEAEKLIKSAKAEAIKEFAERLHYLINPDWCKLHQQVDNLVKEMVGEE